MKSNHEHISYQHQTKVKIFGAQAALCAESVILNKEKQRLHSVNLEVAPRHHNGVDWNRKIVIQLSDTELPLACSVLLGYLPSIHFKRPGKGIELERQANRLFVRGSQGPENIFMLPATIGDTFKLSAMMLSQLKQQASMEDDTLLLAALRGAASLYNREKQVPTS
jgi:hypothetical protein